MTGILSGDEVETTPNEINKDHNFVNPTMIPDPQSTATTTSPRGASLGAASTSNSSLTSPIPTSAGNQPVDPLKLKNFYIIEYDFVEKKKKELLLSLAHIDWIDLEEETVYLPPKNLLKKKDLYKNPPPKDPSKWTLYKCNKLVGPLDYYEAHEKSKEMSSQSDTEKDEKKTEETQDRRTTRKRNAPRRYSPSRSHKKKRSSDDSNGDSSSDDSSSGEESESSSSESDGLEDDGKSDEDDQSDHDAEKTDDSDSSDDDATVKLMAAIHEGNSKQAKTVQPTDATKKKKGGNDYNMTSSEQTRLIEDGFKKLHIEIQNVNSKVDDLMDKPNKKLKHLKKSLPKFPLKNAKAVITLEKKLAKKKYQELFETRLENISGYSVTNFVRNIFRKVLAPKLVEKFSWSGQRTKKCPFKNLRICRSIITAVTNCMGTEAEVKKKIMIKLQHAKNDNERAKNKKLSIADIARMLS